MGRHFSFLLSLAFPTSDELVCVSFCTEQLSFCTAPSDCCASSVILIHNTLAITSRYSKETFVAVRLVPVRNIQSYNFALSKIKRKGSLCAYTTIAAILARSCAKEKNDGLMRTGCGNACRATKGYAMANQFVRFTKAVTWLISCRAWQSSYQPFGQLEMDTLIVSLAFATCHKNRKNMIE